MRSWGGNSAKRIEAVAAGTRRFAFIPPPVPGGEAGRVKEKGIAWGKPLPLVADPSPLPYATASPLAMASPPPRSLTT